MKILVLSTFLICSIVIQNVMAQTGLLERKITEAGSLWKINKLKEAIDCYKKVLSGVEIPGEYLSLVYLRLTEAQYQAGLYDKCLKTISEIKSLPFLPDHHQLKIDELVRKINKIPIIDHTILNNDTKSIARIFVSENRHGAYHENKNFKTTE